MTVTHEMEPIAGADVVVVGSGAAGCAVAGRLASDPGRSIVLVEAGPDLRSRLPPEFEDGWHLPKGYDWGFESEPDAAGGTQPIRRMRLVGGTSWLTRFALRGGRANYDAWEAAGADGWTYDDCLPFLRGLERDLEFGDRPWHGDRGPVPITRYPDLPPTAAHGALLEAAGAVGFPASEDLNDPEASGFGRTPMSSVGGVRVSSLDAYLGDAAPGNVEVRPDALVDAVTFDGARATGVRLADGSTIRASTVVLCAGTFGSPTILLRSGIGPEEPLRRLGIAVRENLPGVGANLADHPGTDVGIHYDGPVRPAPFLHSAVVFRSSLVAADAAPDLFLWLTDPVQADGPPMLEISVLVLTPSSRGSVSLRSADPADPPRINLPGLTSSIDLKRMVEGVGRAEELAAHRAVRRLGGTDAPRRALDRDSVVALIRETLWSYPHVVGTCAMGRIPRTARSSGRTAGCSARRASTSPMRRSSRCRRPGSPTSRRSWSGSGSRPGSPRRVDRDQQARATPEREHARRGVQRRRVLHRDHAPRPRAGDPGRARRVRP